MIHPNAFDGIHRARVSVENEGAQDVYYDARCTCAWVDGNRESYVDAFESTYVHLNLMAQLAAVSDHRVGGLW